MVQRMTKCWEFPNSLVVPVVEGVVADFLVLLVQLPERLTMPPSGSLVVAWVLVLESSLPVPVGYCSLHRMSKQLPVRRLQQLPPGLPGKHHPRCSPVA